MAESTLPETYDPKAVETKWYTFWESHRFFHAPDVTTKPSYCIVIPPPNITGALHMGHALNNTLQDILIRWKRMSGFEVLWQPGTDHAGIATQNVVERELLEKEGKRRQEIGREELIRRIWGWRDAYGDQILKQLRAIGASCDWDRSRFTLDEGLSQAVRECFVRLYNDGLIYRGKYIVNWCPRCLTALADDEVEHEETKGHLWHIRYPLVDGSGFITVATTRPETMLGDTAVAVNPKDHRYSHLIGRMVMLPETERTIPIIADDFVDASFGSGAVKVTPAHDPNDFEIGQRHNLPQVDVMNDDATMSAKAPQKYTGLTREECRKAIVESLKEGHRLEKVREHLHAIGHCYRCNTIIEPRLSDQWFVKMKPLAEAAMLATEKKQIAFHPARWEKFYLQWLTNVRDWCISRQIWWGHRIPVWYCIGDDRCELACKQPIVSRETPTECPVCGSKNLRQDEDVLDTWFSSALWPFSTLGWPQETPALKTFYPTSTLVTDRGIIFFWVARMVMMGLKLMNEIPFKDVYIHGTILDDQGRKMSKSLGNGIDPLEIVDRYGADAMRFSLILLSSEGQDVKLAVSKFEMGRNFCNKLWNASRFSLMHLEGIPRTKPAEKHLSLADRWILHRLEKSTKVVVEALEGFRFNEAAQELYHFVWNDLCDWYLEAIKPLLGTTEESMQKIASQQTLFHVLQSSLSLLHPFLPFITEEIWHSLHAVPEGSIMQTGFPIAPKRPSHEKEAAHFELAKEVVMAIRNIRGEHHVLPSKRLKATITSPDPTKLDALAALKEMIMNLARLEQLDMGGAMAKSEPSATAVVEGLHVSIPQAGMIDIEAERVRLQKEISHTQNERDTAHLKLSNRKFADNAPAYVVDQQRHRLSDAELRLRQLSDALSKLPVSSPAKK